MAGSDDLFQLIESLTPAEKGYFKKYAYKGKTAKDNTYLKLFDVIDKLEAYDEAAITKKMRKVKGFKNLSEAKYYLSRLVMASLLEYSRGTSVDSKLFQMLEELAILYRKGLYQRAFKTLKKAKKMAEDHEKFTVHMSLQRWEEELLHVSGDFSGWREYIGSGFEKEWELIEKWTDYRQLREVCIRFFSLIRFRSNIRDEDYLKEVEALINDPKMAEESLPLSVKAKAQRFYILLKYYRLTGEQEKSYEVRQAHVDLLESHPEMLRENAMSYLRVINNLMGIQLEMERYEEAFRVLRKLDALKFSDLQERAKRFLVSTESRLIIVVNLGAHNTYDIQPIIEDYFTYLPLIPDIEQLIISFDFSLIYFMKGDYDEALNWLEKANELEKTGYLEDIICISKILILISHLELGNYMILESIQASTYRYLLKRKGAYRLENLFLSFIKKIMNKPNREAYQKELIKFKSQVDELSKDTFEKGMFDHFDLDAWLDSKIVGVPMCQIVQEKAPKVGEIPPYVK
ncbi:MAG: hypothetical protein AAF502_02505 [Bacteroidota bacterium]